MFTLFDPSSPMNNQGVGFACRCTLGVNDSNQNQPTIPFGLAAGRYLPRGATWVLSRSTSGNLPTQLDLDR